MFSRLLSIALATTVFSCPFLCGAGAMVDVPAARSGERCCCCHAHDKQAPADDLVPSDQSMKPQGCCQCICGGAVLDAVAGHVPGVDVNCWVALPIVEPVASQLIAARLNASGAVLKRDDGLNPGRAMRCLFMTFLC